jgi:hypothetical protein
MVDDCSMKARVCMSPDQKECGLLSNFLSFKDVPRFINIGGGSSGQSHHVLFVGAFAANRT